MVLKACVGALRAEGQPRQNERGGLESPGVLGRAYCSGPPTGGVAAGAGGRQPDRRLEGSRASSRRVPVAQPNVSRGP